MTDLSEFEEAMFFKLTCDFGSCVAKDFVGNLGVSHMPMMGEVMPVNALESRGIFEERSTSNSERLMKKSLTGRE